MHDPSTVAFDIYLGRKQNKNGRYRSPIITIWHEDPEKDGSDDSCGWFIRSRHIDSKILEKVRKEFEFQFKHEYWFNSGGYPKFTTSGVALDMYYRAAWQIFMYYDDNKPTNRAKRRLNKFMRRYLFDILHFAENSTDSLYGSIWMKYGVEDVKDRVDHFTSVVTADIMRKLRPWYKHPRWHIHHWQITFPGLRSFYRRYFERCDRCRKKLGTQSVYTNWHGTEHWCEKCNNLTQKAVAHP
jgi:hypothetical protein